MLILFLKTFSFFKRHLEKFQQIPVHTIYFIKLARELTYSIDPFSNVGCEFFIQVLVLYGLPFKRAKYPV